MRDEDKPFVCYRRRFGMNIMPRNGEGWRLLGLWLVPLVLLTTGHLYLVAAVPDDDALIGWATAGYALLTVIWAFAMMRWMLERSEVIWLDKGGRK